MEREAVDLISSYPWHYRPTLCTGFNRKILLKLLFDFSECFYLTEAGHEVKTAMTGCILWLSLGSYH